MTASSPSPAETTRETADLVTARLAATQEAVRTSVAQWQSEQDLKLKRMTESVGAMIAALSQRLEQLERALSDAERRHASASLHSSKRESGDAGQPSSSQPSGSTGGADDLQSFLKAGGGLRDWLASNGLEIIDKRASGGSLWALGPTSTARPLLKEAAAIKIRFTFSPGGSKSTDGRAGWFTRSMR